MSEQRSRTTSVPPAQDSSALEVGIGRIQDIFEPLDRAPLEHRRLSSQLTQYLCERFDAMPRGSRLALRISLPSEAMPHEAAIRSAFRHHFERTASEARVELRRHFGTGFRMLLVALASAIGIVFLMSLIADAADSRVINNIVRVLSITVWVVMWRPIETLLHDWRPIQRKALFNQRLATIEVACETTQRPDALTASAAVE